MMQRTRTKKRPFPLALAAAVALTTLWSAPLRAELQPWPFDFDPSIAADPAGIETGLSELGVSLPGLRGEELTEVALGPVTLYFFPTLAETLDRAVSSGPGVMPDVARVPVLCAAHDSFVYPSLLLPSPSSSCRSAESSVAAAFVDVADPCSEVEFPETFVFDHPPGLVNGSFTRSLEGLIAVSGEALRHLDYPEGLIPEDFFSTARPIIAKIRYDSLVSALDEREAAYAAAQGTLSTSASCFQSGPRAALEGAIDDLLIELDAARAHLGAVYEDGLAQAEADRSAALADCRARADLPFPALSDDERLFLASYLGGIYWRARGAGLLAYPADPEMGLLRRILYVGDAFQTLGTLAGGDGARGVGNNLLFDENWGWDEWWDMGTTPGSADKFSDLVGMTKRGKRGANRTRPQLAGRGYDIRSLMGGAMMMGPCYYFAWEELFEFRLGEDLDDPYMWFIEWPTSVGEYCAGAALAEGLSRTLLWGTTIEGCTPSECPGVCDDAGVDAGPEGGVGDAGHDTDVVDTGVSDGGSRPDGGSERDAAPEGDGGIDPVAPESGCSCSASPGGGRGALWLIALIALVALRRLDGADR